ncbi:MAG: methyltransferase (TIGR00027 family) [Phenylobacterium sp.]|jgi:methyltransferase (TIGR00027 family)
MSNGEQAIQDISDTGRWVAVYRARENNRDDAIFHDDYAQLLAGQRGEDIASKMNFPENHGWSYVIRTYLFDQLIASEIAQGVDLVINLAAGLDTRPYRMSLPQSLMWVEVDFPEILSYKEDILSNAQPNCQLERVKMDLSNNEARKALFDDLAEKYRKILVLSEGLLVYFTTEDVAKLSLELASYQSIQRWIFDLVSPMQLRILLRMIGKQLDEGGAKLQFAPKEGVEFFSSYHWKALDVKGLLKTAADFNRLSFGMRLLAKIPEPKGAPGLRPWSGVCLMSNNASGH